MCSMWLSLCSAFLVFPSLPCLSLPAPLSHGDMLEVIITIASGFISIYSHNNTEKGEDRQHWCDVLSSTGIIFHNDIQQSFPSLPPPFSFTHTYTHFLHFSLPISTPLCPPFYYHRIHGAPQPVNLCRIIISCGDNSHCTETIMM